MENEQIMKVRVDRKSQIITVTGKHGRAVYDPKTREMEFVLYMPEGATRGILKLPDKTKTPALQSRRSQKKNIQLT